MQLIYEAHQNTLPCSILQCPQLTSAVVTTATQFSSTLHTLLTINTHTGVAAVFCCMSVHKLIKRSAVGTRHKMTIKLSKLVRPMQGSVTSYNAE